MKFYKINESFVFSFNHTSAIIKSIRSNIYKILRSEQTMLKLEPVELFLRALPEALLYIFASYAFSKRFVDKKRFLISGGLLAIAGFFVRALPINFGVHTILGLIACIVLVVNVNKIEVPKAISAGIICMILGFITEGINVLILVGIFNVDISEAFLSDPIKKTILGIPSLLMFGAIVGSYYYVMWKRKELKYVSDRKDI
jgi:hypothetical protein